MSNGESPARTLQSIVVNVATVLVLPFYIASLPVVWLFFTIFVESSWKRKTTVEERARHDAAAGSPVTLVFELTALYLRGIPIDEYYRKEGYRHD